MAHWGLPGGLPGVVLEFPLPMCCGIVVCGRPSGGRPCALWRSSRRPPGLSCRARSLAARVVLRKSMRESPPGSPRKSRRGSPRESPRGSPAGSPQKSPAGVSAKISLGNLRGNLPRKSPAKICRENLPRKSPRKSAAKISRENLRENLPRKSAAKISAKISAKILGWLSL